MRFKGAVLGVAGLAAVLGIVVFGGAAVGVGPLAATTPPDKVTDPREMVARSLQAVLDATAVHLDATLTGTLAGAVLDRPEAQIDLAGTVAEGDIRPKDAKTRAHIASGPLGVELDTVTIWDGVWYRTGADAPWTKASAGGAAAQAGVDINPLTLVDRLRSYLARPDLAPVVTDVACASTSGRCHRVVIDAGSDPGSTLAAMLPVERQATFPEVTTTLTLDTDSLTLRPSRIVMDVASEDGTVDLHLVVDASRWDEELVIAEPSAGS